MTLFGIDVSSHQDGMSLAAAKRDGIDFAIIRLCDGTYRDPVFRSHLADAEGAGLIVATYWYLRSPCEGTTIAQQVDVIDEQMGGRRDLGVWIDVESVGRDGRKLLTGGDVWAAKRELERRGYTVPGVYSGAWYWEQMPGGEPDMTGLGALWVSNYGANRRGGYRSLYPGDDSTRWTYPLGNRTPDLLQYGSNGEVGGWAVDVNAFRGGADELRALFAGRHAPAAPAPAPAPGRVEKVLPYRRDQVAQDTGFWCGPATAQTIIRARTGRLLLERDLAREMGTTTAGTNGIGQVAASLRAHVPEGRWEVVQMPHDPPTDAERERLWRDVRRSIDAGFGVAVNVWCPPDNYPRPSHTSTEPLRYGGGFVRHYIALMGYAVDDGGARHVWIADSGFRPHGAWCTLEQMATMIPPRGYAYAAVDAPEPKPEPSPAPADPAPTPPDQEGPHMLDERITSLINPRVQLRVRDLLALLDAYAWEQRAVMRALCAAQGVDYDAVRDAAVAADRKDKP